MCIICAKNKGIEMPSWDIIENMWYNNTDGAGLMWVEDGAVRISKGYMKYEDFEAELNRLGERLDLKETPVVMHFSHNNPWRNKARKLPSVSYYRPDWSSPEAEV